MKLWVGLLALPALFASGCELRAGVQQVTVAAAAASPPAPPKPSAAPEESGALPDTPEPAPTAVPAAVSAEVAVEKVRARFPFERLRESDSVTLSDRERANWSDEFLLLEGPWTVTFRKRVAFSLGGGCAVGFMNAVPLYGNRFISVIGRKGEDGDNVFTACL